jgi:hypothetical protein
MVEVDGLVRGIEPVGADLGGDPLGYGVAAVGTQIGDRRALAVHVPATFELVGGGGPAPKEILAEYAHRKHSFMIIRAALPRKTGRLDRACDAGLSPP